MCSTLYYRYFLTQCHNKPLLKRFLKAIQLPAFYPERAGQSINVSTTLWVITMLYWKLAFKILMLSSRSQFCGLCNLCQRTTGRINFIGSYCYNEIGLLLSITAMNCRYLKSLIAFIFLLENSCNFIQEDYYF